MNGSVDISGSLAASAQSLDKLRVQAKHSPEQALKAAAQQFEAVFLNMMLKSMRDATPQDSVFDNEQTRMLTGMLDQQLAQSMSDRGVGLADIMVKQLSKSLSPGTAKIEQQALPASRSSTQTLSYSENLQHDFVRRITPYASQVSKETGIPVSLMVGQAALESGWGQHEIRMSDGSNSHNLLGIKTGSNWDGKIAETMTTEYRNGKAEKQIGQFRAYDSYIDAFRDYANLLRNNPRYAQVLADGQITPDTAYALQKAGYATDPNYADKLSKVLRTINTLG